MLRRGGHLLTRARERIRAAREHDPHAWPHDPPSAHPDDDYDEDLDEEATGDGADRPPLGSPEPGTPDLDGPLGPGGVSGARSRHPSGSPGR